MKCLTKISAKPMGPSRVETVHLMIPILHRNGHVQVPPAAFRHCLGKLWPLTLGKVEADPESITFGISQDRQFFLERLKQWACPATTTVKGSVLTSLIWDCCWQCLISLGEENETTHLFGSLGISVLLASINDQPRLHWTRLQLTVN